MASEQDADHRLDYGERWLRDGLEVFKPSLSVYQTEVDMTKALAHLEQLRLEGVRATATHLIIAATARVLAANADLHQMVAGARRHRPKQVDIGLSIAGETFVAPVLVVEQADRKSVGEIVATLDAELPRVREADRRMLAALRRWGWLVPFGPVRRGLLRALFRSPSFRRKGVGTFQISSVPVEWAFSTSFAATGLLVCGKLTQRVTAVDGQPAVRPMMTLTLCSDHGVWDGRAAARFLAGVRSELGKS